MDRPPVHAGMLITPDVLLALGASTDCDDWKRFKAHASGFERDIPAHTHTLSVNFLQWAASAGYGMGPLAELLLGHEWDSDVVYTAEIIWDALLKPPKATEIPGLPEWRSDQKLGQECSAHFTALCDALEKRVESQEELAHMQEGTLNSHHQRIAKLGSDIAAIVRDLGGKATEHDGNVMELFDRIEKLEKGVYALPGNIAIVPPGVAAKPDDPFAKGKWVIWREPCVGVARGTVFEIVEGSGPGNEAGFWVEKKGGRQWVAKSLSTPLLGTDKDCKLEVGDVVSGPKGNSLEREVLAVHKSRLFLLPKERPEDALAEYRTSYRLTRRPPKEKE